METFSPGVSILKGHKGISDYLMTLPDIDINMKDDDGKTILMNMFVNQVWSSEFSGMGLDKTVKDKCRDIFVTFIEKFIVTYSPCMEVEITIKEKVQQFLPLLLFSKHSDEHLRGIKVILNLQ